MLKVPPIDPKAIPRSQIATEVAKRFAALRRLATIELNRALAPLGASAAMYNILLRLSMEREVAQQDLVFDAGLDAAGVSRLITRLAERKLVSVRVDASDRRKKVIALTSEGESFARTLEPVVDAAMRRLVGGLDEGEERELLRILDKALQGMIQTIQKSK